MTYDRATGWLAGFQGVVSALVTPFDDDTRVDPDAIERVVELQLRAGIPAVMLGGTTGEFVAMEERERRDTVRYFLEAIAGRARAAVNVGHVDARQAHRLAEHAVELGADAVAAITPYFLPHTAAAAERYFRELARSVPETAFMVYDFPRNTTNGLPTSVLGALLDEPNVCGAKCSVATLAELQAYLEVDGATIMSGNDGLFAEFVAAGGRAVVSGNAAAHPELIVRAFARCLDGSWTDDDARLVADIARAGRDGAPDRLKRLLALRGEDGGTARVRTYVDEDVTRDGNDEAAARVEHALRTLSAESGRSDLEQPAEHGRPLG